MLSLKLRPMLVFTMEDMDMVMDMQVLDMQVLDMLARDLLMPSQKLRLMPASIMEDMDMVLDMQVSDMLDTDMDTLPTDTPPLDTTVRDLLMLSQRPRLMLDSTMEDMDMVLAML